MALLFFVFTLAHLEYKIQDKNWSKRKWTIFSLLLFECFFKATPFDTASVLLYHTQVENIKLYLHHLQIDYCSHVCVLSQELWIFQVRSRTSAEKNEAVKYSLIANSQKSFRLVWPARMWPNVQTLQFLEMVFGMIMNIEPHSHRHTHKQASWRMYIYIRMHTYLDTRTHTHAQIHIYTHVNLLQISMTIQGKDLRVFHFDL